jgi:hypothetical protein
MNFLNGTKNAFLSSKPKELSKIIHLIFLMYKFCIKTEVGEHYEADNYSWNK